MAKKIRKNQKLQKTLAKALKSIEQQGVKRLRFGAGTRMLGALAMGVILDVVGTLDEIPDIPAYRAMLKALAEGNLNLAEAHVDELSYELSIRGHYHGGLSFQDYWYKFLRGHLTKILDEARKRGETVTSLPCKDESPRTKPPEGAIQP